MLLSRGNVTWRLSIVILGDLHEKRNMSLRCVERTMRRRPSCAKVNDIHQVRFRTTITTAVNAIIIN